MAGHITLQPSTTWVSALGEVRALTHAFPLPPPDPPDWCQVPISSPVLESFPAEEGEAAEAPTNNQLKPLTPDTIDDWDDWDDWAEFNICKPCGDSPPSTTTVDWSDFNEHAGKDWTACVAKLIPSFGPLGLLSGIPNDDEPFVEQLETYVDTGASLTVTPFRSDFCDYEELDGNKTLKGLSAGASIKGRGVVHWRIELGDKTIGQLLFL